MWRAAAFLVAILLAGCVTPVEVTSALKASLPPEDVPFLVLAQACGPDAPLSLLVLYPDGRLVHAVLDARASGADGQARAASTTGEQAVLDAASAGALDASRFVDAEGHVRSLAHAEELDVAAEFDDLRTRVTLAGFPALDAAYGPADGCTDDYAAWVDGQHWHVTDRADSAPWALRHVGEGLRDVHA